MGKEQSGERPRLGARGRRRLVRALTGILVLVSALGGTVASARLVGNTERVTALWVGARLATDGSARITEVVDYDFGHPDIERHGIYRDLPDLPDDEGQARVAVTVDGHRVPWELTVGDSYTRPDGRREPATRIKIGDPDRTVSGVHRYRLQYTLQGVVKKGRLAWDTVGTGWRVDRSRVEVHVVAPYLLTAPHCVHGTDGAEHRCAVEATGPGLIDTRPIRLKGREGLTLYATRGHPVSGMTALLPAPPAKKAAGTTTTHPLPTGLCTAGGALAVVLVATGLLRLAGRDRRAPEGADDIPGTPAPPPGLGPAEGGILLVGRVRPEHQAAWLLAVALDGRLTVEGTDTRPVLRRRNPGGAGAMDPDVREVLRTMFAGRSRVTLGHPDPSFRAGWQALARHLRTWQAGSGLWTTASLRIARAGRYAGLAGAVLGFVTSVAGAFLGGSRDPAAGPVLIAGVLGYGLGLALSWCSWQLHRRTAEGSAMLRHVKAFRAYLADPSPHSGTEPLGDDRVRLYSAWAVALDVDRGWQAALERAVVPTLRRPPSAVRMGPALAAGLAAAAVSSQRTPSSGGSSGGSGSGDFGGGGSSGDVGGGAGGGGGGSW